MTCRSNPSGRRGLDQPVLQDVTEPPVRAGCGRPFTPTRAQQRFCRPSCRWLGKPVQLVLFQ